MNATSLPTATVLVDGLRIRYADSGTDGPVILLTSPWPESLLAFRRVWPVLARTARLVAMDLPGFGHSEGRADVFTPSAMGEFLLRFIADRELGSPHLVAPDVGTSAALFLAARYPNAVRSLMVGGGATAFPLEVGGTLADIIAAPGIEVFEAQDIRATIGATVEPVAPRSQRRRVGDSLRRATWSARRVAAGYGTGMAQQKNGPGRKPGLTCAYVSGRYWDRTSDLLGVNSSHNGR